MQLCNGAATTKTVTHEAPQRGARVAAVDAAAMGPRGGLAPGDIIYQVNGRRVESGKAAAAALDGAAGSIVLINFWRDGVPYLARLWTKPQA